MPGTHSTGLFFGDPVHSHGSFFLLLPVHTHGVFCIAPVHSHRVLLLFFFICCRYALTAFFVNSFLSIRCTLTDPSSCSNFLHRYTLTVPSSLSVDPIDVLLWQLASILSTPIAPFPSERTHVHFRRHAADPFFKPLLGSLSKPRRFSRIVLRFVLNSTWHDPC